MTIDNSWCLQIHRDVNNHLLVTLAMCPHQHSYHLSLHFNGHFPGGPRLAETRMSPFWILLELRVIEMVVTTGAITHAKLQSNCHHQQTNTQLFTGQMPFLSPNSVRALKGNASYCIIKTANLNFASMFFYTTFTPSIDGNVFQIKFFGSIKLQLAHLISHQNSVFINITFVLWQEN